MKTLLVVDMEKQYFTDNDVLGMLDEDCYRSTQKQIENQYIKVIRKINNLKKNGWKIYFTGKEKPYERLVEFVDVVLPYWADNQEILKETFKNQTIFISGLWLERCVSEVNKIINNSVIIKKLTLSHGIIGDPSPMEFGIKVI